MLSTIQSINFASIQTILMPTSFGFLFALMLLYWGQIAFFSYTKYLVLNLFVLNTSFLLLTSILGIRWIESGHFPLSNLFESLLFLSWSFLFSLLILQFSTNQTGKHRLTAHQHEMPSFGSASSSFTGRCSAPGDEGQVSPKEDPSVGLTFYTNTTSLSLHDLFGIMISPLALLTYAFAFLNLPKDMQKATSLVPALQSNWLMMHVTVMILSYATLLCGSILSMAFLLVRFLSQRPYSALAVTQGHCKAQGNPAEAELRTQNSGEESQVSLCGLLDNYSYRILGFGFPLLTIGILSGAVWANSAWGSYWSWDPKETWALITWLLFAIYLHARITKGWSGEKPAYIATAGFFVLWFCYLGVNLIGSGLHTYGTFLQ